MRRSIQELSVQEVLALAMDVERRNASRFETFSLLFGDYNNEVSDLFAEMKKEEDDHWTMLDRMYRARFGTDQCTVSELDVEEVVEAVDIDDSEHLIFDSMNQRRVLEAGMRAEDSARRFYSGLVDNARDPELRLLFIVLSTMEEGHLQALKDAQSRMDAGGPVTVRTGGFVVGASGHTGKEVSCHGAD